jgi:hypothetical protein
MTAGPAARAALCSAGARARGDVMHATAAPVLRWLLVEQPGPWGRDALAQSRLDLATSTALTQRAAVAGVRVVLIRRPGRHVHRPARHWAYADSRPGHEGTWWGMFHDEAELLGVALDGSEGERSDEPAYLVCTHARHDACCAVRGRPLAAALARLRPEQTWECSHVGGDRFAANVVVLPHGLYYGQVEDTDAERLVRAQAAGEVVPDILRGRSAFSAAAQAAQHYAREALGDLRIDALRPHDVDDLGRDRWRVTLGSASGDVLVTVRAEVAPLAARLTCAAPRAERPRRFVLEELRLAPQG